jgi:hypothetical protein
MTDYTGHTFQGGRVALDGNSFKGCTFDSCELVFSGGIPPALSGCSFRNTSMRFEGTAGNTIAFLKAMATPSSGLQRVIRDTFRALSAH